MSRVKLFFVDGMRHSAVVLASDADEAVRLADAAHGGDKDPRVLFGSVGSWEVPVANELRLPDGYRLVGSEPKARSAGTRMPKSNKGKKKASEQEIPSEMRT